tara:strand:- start:287 stop:2344 length:2058 start_codon:yes stop_codon:yes gene_type:complete
MDLPPLQHLTLSDPAPTDATNDESSALNWLLQYNSSSDDEAPACPLPKKPRPPLPAPAQPPAAPTPAPLPVPTPAPVPVPVPAPVAPKKPARVLHDDESDDEPTPAPAADGEEPPAAAPTPLQPLAPVQIVPSQRALATAVDWGTAYPCEGWGPSMLCAYPTGAGKTLAALNAVAMWVRSGPTASATTKRPEHYTRIAYCIARTATIPQWIAEWQRLLQGYHDRARFLPAVDTPLPLSFTDTRTSTLYRSGNLYVGTIDALLKHAQAGDFTKRYRLKNIMLVYDEAHSIRDPKATSVAPLLEFASYCGYRLLLTATPIFNSVADLEVIGLLLERQKQARDTPRFDRDMSDDEIRATIDEVFNDTARVVYVEPDRTKMPVVDKTVRVVPLGAEYDEWLRPLDAQGDIQKALRLFGQERVTLKLMQEYYARQPQEDRFLLQSRQSTNRAKYKPLFDAILDRSGASRRVVVISSFRAFGVDGFSDYLVDERGLELKVRTDFGGIETLVLPSIQSPYGVPVKVAQWKKNELAPYYKAWYEADGARTVKVLLLSPMASTGVSLRHTNEIHLLEPFFSPYEEQQAVGRAIRFDSHSDLPQEQRRVDVVSWIGVLPAARVAALANAGGDGAAAVVPNAHLQTADQRVREINELKRARLEVPWGRLRAVGAAHLNTLLAHTPDDAHAAIGGAP